nr:MAG TPA: hypothetical protein [Caudoviricetes sp.]
MSSITIAGFQSQTLFYYFLYIDGTIKLIQFLNQYQSISG